MTREETSALGNGVFLHYLPTERFKNAVLSVNLLYPQKKGMSSCDTMIPRLLMRSCDLYPTRRQMATRLSELYGTSVSQSSDRIGKMRLTGFTADFPERRYTDEIPCLPSEVISLLFRMLCHPRLLDGSFDPTLVEHEKKAMLEEFAAIRNRKATYAVYRCRSFLRAKRGYDLPSGGSEEEVEKLTPRTLIQQYRYFLRHSALHISYVGSEPKERLIAAIRAATVDLPRGTVCEGALIAGVRNTAKLLRINEPTEGTQCILVLGYRTGLFRGEPATDAFHLMTEILSDSPMSKLFRNVREKKQLCYSIQAMASLRTGILMICAGIDSRRKEEAERAIRLEIAAMKAGRITEEEISCARESLLNTYESIPDSPYDLESYYSSEMLFPDAKTVSERVNILSNLTVEDVRETASHLSLSVVYCLDPRGGKANEPL